MRLQGKVAIVTGAASGIGRAIAERFAREGARVVAADIDGARVSEVAASIMKSGGKAEALTIDVTNEEQAKQLTTRALELWQQVDILVNNAASFHYKRVEEATRADWDKVLSVNVVGTSLCSKYACAAMKARNQGAIVNIASINGIIAMPNWMTYNASKAAVIEISKSMAMDLAPFNIRVNCVCPGVTDTPALHRAMKELDLTPQALIDGVVAPRALIKRFGTADEIANAALFVASDEASYMTGATMVVDGGFTA
jgi:NAD(P)-dependent dehydrogenase (short-subunit alcohol dehydrogenase family)